MITKRLSITILLVVFLCLVNHYMTKLNYLIDFSSSKTYSLSPFSQQLLKDFDDPIHFKLFISESMHSLEPAKVSLLLNLLQNIKHQAPDYVHLDIIHEHKNNQNFQNHALFNIPKIPVAIYDKFTQDETIALFGLAIIYEDQVEIIPYFNHSSTYEYQIAIALNNLINKNKVSLTIVHPNLNEFKNNYSVFLNGLTDLYNLNIVDYESFSLKERNPTLFFSPPSLTDDDFSKINTFFKNHGKAIFFIDQFIEKSLQINHYDTNINTFLKNYGLTVSENLVLDSVSERIPFDLTTTLSNVNSYQTISYQHYPYFPLIFSHALHKPLQINQSYILAMPWVSSIHFNSSNSNSTHSVIASSSEKSSWQESFPFITKPNRD